MSTKSVLRIAITHTDDGSKMGLVDKSAYEAMLEPHTNPWALDCIRKAQERGQTERPRSNPFSKEERRRNGTTGITRAEYGVLMNPKGKNKRDVWNITTEKFGGPHSATMLVKLAEICVLAGSGPGDLVVDPFCGTGTTRVAALKHSRKFVGINPVPEIVEMARGRLSRFNSAAREPQHRERDGVIFSPSRGLLKL